MKTFDLTLSADNAWPAEIKSTSFSETLHQLYCQNSMGYFYYLDEDVIGEVPVY